MKHLKKIILSLLVVFIFSCKGKSGSSVTADTNPSVPEKAMVPQKEDTLKSSTVFQLGCLSDPTKSYAVYLPGGYSKNVLLPVVYFFDPHADGSLPVIKYKSLADEFNWVLIGCNNSKNGMTFPESQAVANMMINDVVSRLYIDNKLQFVAGFSGGSKVACNLATTNSTFAGLIACSGSYMNNQSPFSSALTIAAVAGERDFNYHEMVQFNEAVSNTNAHLFIATDNTHEWPELSAMKDAFVFMVMRGMQKQTIAKNEKQVNSFLELDTKKAAMLEKQNNALGAYSCYQKIVSTYKGLTDITFAEQKIIAIEKSQSFKVYMEKKQSLDTQEPQFQQYYAEAIPSKDIAWWNNEIDKLKKSSELKSDKLWSAYNSRMLGFLGIMCYSYAGKAVKANVGEAEKILAIYKTVEPDNSEAYFLSAVYAANNSNVELAATELKEAMQKGFTDKQRLNEYPSLVNVIYRANVKAMLDTIH